MTTLAVDAYNVIRQCEPFTSLEIRDFLKGRTALIHAAARYSVTSQNRVVLFFDAGKGGLSAETKERHGGIEVRYSARGETADTAIVRFASTYAGKDLIVVSSDRALRDGARQFGALLLSASEFGALLKKANEPPSPMPLSSRDKAEPDRGRLDTHKKGPSRRMPKKKRQALSRARFR